MLYILGGANLKVCKVWSIEYRTDILLNTAKTNTPRAKYSLDDQKDLFQELKWGIVHVLM